MVAVIVPGRHAAPAGAPQVAQEKRPEPRAAAGIPAAGITPPAIRGIPAVPAPAGKNGAENDKQDDQHKDGAEYPRTAAAALIFRFWGRQHSGGAGDGNAVTAFIPVYQRGKYFLHAHVVILGGKIRLQIFIQHLLELACGEFILNPVAWNHTVIVVANGQQQQNTVVFLLGADLPLIEHGIAVIGNIRVVQKVHRGHHDLPAGLFVQTDIGGHDAVLGFITEHAGKIIDIKLFGRLRNVHFRRSGQSEQNRQKHGQNQKHTDALFH